MCDDSKKNLFFSPICDDSKKNFLFEKYDENN